MITIFNNVPTKDIAVPKLSLIILLQCLAFLTACSTTRGANELSEVIVVAQGANIKSRPEMAEACKGFHVSPQKIKDFYYYSALTQEEKNNRYNEKLPCYSSGVANVGYEEFQWVLRSGGIIEFSNEDSNFTKICGIACCDIVQGVC